MNFGSFGGDEFTKNDVDWFSNSCLPKLQDDETLYSWCARFHRLNVGHSSNATSRVLFGHQKAGLRHDIPGHLGVFQLRTQGALGETLNLLRKHTLFGFHAPFLTADVELDLIKQLIAGDSNNVRKKLGLERSGLAAVNPLKFCPKCVKQQIRDNGFTWWQTSLQLPTTFQCQVHSEWLCNHVDRQFRGLFTEFQLPLEGGNSTATGHYELAATDRTQLIRLGNWGELLHQCHNLRLTDAKLRYCYLLKAKTWGWISLDGSVRLKAVRDAFVDRYDGALRLFGSDFFGELDGVNAGFLAYMFRKHPCRRHPLKHVMLLNLLFDTFEDFIEVFDKAEVVVLNGGDEALKKMLCDNQMKLLGLIAEGGRSISSAAAEIGISVKNAASYLDRSGLIDRPRRPHIVGTDKESKLCEMLRQGLERSVIAESLGLKKSFIKDYLADRPELKKVWNETNHNLQLHLHRDQLSRMLTQHPDLPMKFIRRLPGNGMQWLYNHDRNWLIEALPAIWKR